MRTDGRTDRYEERFIAILRTRLKVILLSQLEPQKNRVELEWTGLIWLRNRDESRALVNTAVSLGVPQLREFFWLVEELARFEEGLCYMELVPCQLTCYSLRLHINVQGDQKVSVHLMITIHVFLVSLLGSIWLLGSRPPGPGGH
jgi:hypothetical protein